MSVTGHAMARHAVKGVLQQLRGSPENGEAQIPGERVAGEQPGEGILPFFLERNIPATIGICTKRKLRRP